MLDPVEGDVCWKVTRPIKVRVVLSLICAVDEKDVTCIGVFSGEQGAGGFGWGWLSKAEYSRIAVEEKIPLLKL